MRGEGKKVREGTQGERGRKGEREGGRMERASGENIRRC